ncbi:MAG: GGDEF domain-containing protein [Natronospirillum sp.]
MPDNNDIRDFHWMVEILQTIDIGLVVIDNEYKITTWNAFMENHSGKQASSVKSDSIFDVFPELPEQWFRQKTDTVRMLNIRTFTTWEQRPYLARFRNYHPITSTAEFMYQNSMLYPIVDTRGAVTHIALVIFDVTDIATSKLALQEANGELERLSRTDGLSQLFNRSFWEECLHRELQRSRRHQHPASLIILDVDLFKEVNDTHGHVAGDDVIRFIGRQMRLNLRETDVGGRYGGEEFAIILPETSADDALVFAERLRYVVEEATMKHDDSEFKITISLGIAELDEQMSIEQNWIEAADHALYESKKNGRNRTTIFRRK